MTANNDQSRPELCKMYLVRHGETEWNVKGIFQGHSDSPLTDNGVSQAKAVAEQLFDVEFTQVFTSDLGRSKRTAEIIAAERDLAVVTTKALREVHLGRFEGQPVKRFLKELREKIEKRAALSSWDEWKQFELDPEIESVEQIMSRVLRFLREVAVGYPGENVLLTTHGGVLRHLLSELGFTDNWEYPAVKITNTAWIQLDSDGVDFFIRDTHGIEVVEESS